MKTANDPRHRRRIHLVSELFAYSFTGEVSDAIRAIVDRVSEIDQKIASVATNWDIAGINKVDLAILRLAVFELEQKETPATVVIDEAIEIAKTYGADASKSFVNAVLSKIAGSV